MEGPGGTAGAQLGPMVMLLLSTVLGLSVGLVGFWLAPGDVCPRAPTVLIASVLGALPGVAFGAVSLEDRMLGIDSAGLAVSIIGATLVVGAVAFSRERRSAES